MANIFEFNGYRPVVHPSAFVHPNATVTGNVTIGADVYIGPGAAIRGDWGEIIIEDGCNVQENCTIHMFPGTTVLLKKGAHIGHGAIIHGATIGENSLIGMNSVIMDNVIVGDECIVGALCFIPADTKIKNRKVVVGNPGKEIKDVSDFMIKWKTEGTKLYQQLPRECHNTLKACEALTRQPAFKPKQQDVYKTWNENKGKAEKAQPKKTSAPGSKPKKPAKKIVKKPVKKTVKAATKPVAKKPTKKKIVAKKRKR